MAKVKPLSEHVRFLCFSALPEPKAGTFKSTRPFADFIIFSLFQTLTSAQWTAIHVIPMQHVITIQVLMTVSVEMDTQEMTTLAQVLYW